MALLFAAAALTIAALFPDYYQHAPALAADRQNVVYNLAAILVWAVSAILLCRSATFTSGAAMAFASTILWLPAYLPDIGDVITGSDEAGPGFILGLIGLACALAGALTAAVCVWRHRPRRMVRQSVARWAAAGAVLAVVYDIATATDWIRSTARLTQPGFTFKSSGTSVSTNTCCTVFDTHGWSMVSQLLLYVLIVAFVVAILGYPHIFGSFAALSGVALIALAAPLSSVAELTQKPTPADFGVTAATASQSGEIFMREGTIGLWATFAAGFALLILAALRHLSLADQQQRTSPLIRSYHFAGMEQV